MVTSRIRETGILRKKVEFPSTLVSDSPGQVLRIELANQASVAASFKIYDGVNANGMLIGGIVAPTNQSIELLPQAMLFNTGLFVAFLVGTDFGSQLIWVEYRIDARAPLKDKLPDGL